MFAYDKWMAEQAEQNRRDNIDKWMDDFVALTADLESDTAGEWRELMDLVLVARELVKLRSG